MEGYLLTWLHTDDFCKGKKRETLKRKHTLKKKNCMGKCAGGTEYCAMGMGIQS